MFDCILRFEKSPSLSRFVRLNNTSCPTFGRIRSGHRGWTAKANGKETVKERHFQGNLIHIMDESPITRSAPSSFLLPPLLDTFMRKQYDLISYALTGYVELCEILFHMLVRKDY